MRIELRAQRKRFVNYGVLIDYVALCFLHFVQPVLSYGCEIWGLEHPDSWRQMSSIHHMFMKHTLHVRRSTPSDIVLCELGQVPLHLFWYKALRQVQILNSVVDR